MIFSSYYPGFGTAGSSPVAEAIFTDTITTSTSGSASANYTVSSLQGNSASFTATQFTVASTGISMSTKSSLDQTSSSAGSVENAMNLFRVLKINSVIGTTDNQTVTGTPTGGIIVPLYTPPSDNSWTELFSAKNAHPDVPMIAIINPDSGPVSNPAAQWVTGIDQLRLAGISVIGYVATGYGTTPVSTVEEQIHEYSTFYPGLNGIFFDEMANFNGTGSCSSSCTMQQYYQDLVNYSSSIGFNLSVGNPGSTSIPSLNGIMNILIIYENFGSPSPGMLQRATMGYNRNSYGAISIGVGLNATQELSSTSYAGWIYMTDLCTGQSVSACNPYDGLPSYFSSLVSNLAR